jgi:hypothetical protein
VPGRERKFLIFLFHPFFVYPARPSLDVNIEPAPFGLALLTVAALNPAP